MPLDATVGGANSNSFITVEEADAYWADRAHIALWDETTEEKTSLLITATRMIVAAYTLHRRLIRTDSGDGDRYLISRTWTGAPTTTTQALPWPRIGMYDRNENAIPSNVIPQDLKFATAELAGQISKTDRLIENDVAVQGIKSVSAGSVSVNFKDNVEPLPLLPQIVDMWMVPSWLTDESIEFVQTAQFDVVSYGSYYRP